MKRKLSNLIGLFLTAGILVGSPLLVNAQSDYPNKPIRLIAQLTLWAALWHKNWGSV